MVLVDTSVWVSFLSDREPLLKKLLNNGDVVCHPFIIGELACGNIKNRSEVLSLLHALPGAEIADHSEVLRFIEDNRLMGRGLGLIDVHLLTSAVLSDVSLFTLDKSLKLAASEFSIDYSH